MTMGRRFAAIDAFVAAIVIAGAIVLGLAAWALPSTPHVRDWGVLAALALVASRFPLRVPGRSAWFSISDTFFMTSALLFGPAPAIGAAMLRFVLSRQLFPLRCGPTTDTVADPQTLLIPYRIPWRVSTPDPSYQHEHIPR